MKFDQKLKAAYLKYSAKKYTLSRKPLFENGAVIHVYAHELDGCPIRSLHNRLSRIQIRSHDIDRGDSRETGFGTVHGLPAGIEITVDVTDIVSDIVPRGRRVKLHGTPDFLAIDDGYLVVLDAKSPRRRKIEDGPRGYRVSRMATYVRLLERVREAGFVILDDGSTYPAKDIVYLAASRTPWPVDEIRLGERNKSILPAIVVDSPETRSYEILRIESEVSEIVDEVPYRIRMFVKTVTDYIHGGRKAVFSDLDIESYVRELHSDQDRARECSYCNVFKCPLAESVVVLRFTDISRKAENTKDGRRYRIGRPRGYIEVLRYDPGSAIQRRRDPIQGELVKLYTSDRELVEYTSESGWAVYAKATKLNGKSDDVYDRYRIRARFPSRLEEFLE